MKKEEVLEKARGIFGEVVSDHHFADAASMALVAWSREI